MVRQGTWTACALLGRLPCLQPSLKCKVWPGLLDALGIRGLIVTVGLVAKDRAKEPREAVR